MVSDALDAPAATACEWPVIDVAIGAVYLLWAVLHTERIIFWRWVRYRRTGRPWYVDDDGRRIY